MEQTKEHFSKFILGQKATPQTAKNIAKLKIPKYRSEEEAQAATRAGKRSLSKSGSGQDSGPTHINTIMQGNTPKEADSYSEDDCHRRCPGVLVSSQGGANLQTHDTGHSYRNQKKGRSRGGHSSERYSSHSHNKDNSWVCPQCSNCNFIKSYNCIKCGLACKNISNFIPLGPQLHLKKGGKK